MSNIDCSDQFSLGFSGTFALIFAELTVRNKSLGKSEMFPIFKKAQNPILANDNDSQQNHFMDLMSTQNDRKLLDEVPEIMWFHDYSIHMEQTYCEGDMGRTLKYELTLSTQASYDDMYSLIPQYDYWIQ